MDKFILGENPMRPDDHGVYIIHLLDPIAIISASNVFTLRKKEDTVIWRQYDWKNSDGIIEQWTLSIYHLFTTNFIAEPEEQARPVLDRAWRWYRAYMEWEDKNIDNL